ILFAEKPKITPHKAAMKEKIADILNIKPEQIGLKAKTGEKVGVVGREEAICAECAALLKSV
ncbi:MAG: 2-C-methyl-D-erythritol 2,4-cyclodiphosphate synthase, partial [Planctomycetaceae bacterium]|nr:2-C-methyl-D-erythritol 2,4-cyclodiphosphate synthase [Planctomycetaceae bacterium]